MSALPPAYAVNRNFPACPRSAFCMDRHYLLYARTGTMRLEHRRQQWSLPPARAALIRADTPVWVTITHPLSACSVLFSTDAYGEPPAQLSVFDMTPLARELLLACRGWGPDDTPQPAMAAQLFATLAAVAWDQSTRPSVAMMPLGTSRPVIDALSHTEAGLGCALSFDAVAAHVALTPRTLARRFAAELGLSWGQALRRMRMIRAAETLAMTDAQVTGIALDVGYASISAFNAAFHDFTGKSPSAWREEIRLRQF